MNHLTLRGLRRFGVVAALFALVMLGTGCAAVQQYERERLADRIMTFDGDAKHASRRTKSLDAREGSTGGNGGAGGGCACN
ncbi:MAG: DUF4266 domain-containing protein [Candidatus Eisenbacteria bacterium]|uniref:DUF4266 domain-containing protein n=1 Tax=Eiseniibacteriota bacterium TaxID=2212470 RepID=A0A849SLV7_UNCEI|nr:DUF4266 domain-containing protein [Candidatus Eisenbacteria bacterium]